MFIKIVIALAAVVAVILIVASLQPPDFKITRSATIAAPPAIVFAQVNDFHNWNSWSPWAKMDPAAKSAFEGPSSGTGAGFTWDGNSKVGTGRMTITESRPNDLIRIKLDFIKPFEGHNIAEFSFKPEAGGTVLTWSMSGRKAFIPKVMCLFMNMDKMVGGNFEQGLASIKAISEAMKNR